MEYFGRIIQIHLEYLWRYLKNLLLKAQLISKPGLVAQGLVLSTMDIFPRMEIPCPLPWPVWPRQPKAFVTWPGSAPWVPHVPLVGWGCLGMSLGVAEAMVNIVLDPMRSEQVLGSYQRGGKSRGHSQGPWQGHSGWHQGHSG